MTMAERIGRLGGKRAFVVLIICCWTLLLLQSIHGFSPSSNIVVNYDGLSKHATVRSTESPLPMRIRQDWADMAIEIIPTTTTTSLLASNRVDSANEPAAAGVAAATAAATAAISSSSLNPIEAWCTTHMNVWYDRSLNVKCPFFRRRMTDFLDGADMVMRFLVIRHKSLPLIGPPPGCRSALAKAAPKHKHLELETLVETIRDDWRPQQRDGNHLQLHSQQQQQPHKGYYITGKMNTTIYRDDCWFDGPDPDMPVRGVRKYLNAASQLFDKSASTAELLSLKIGTEDTALRSRSWFAAWMPSSSSFTTAKSAQKPTTIVARWKLKGVLQLPWHPSLPEWKGTTIYHLDEDHLVYKHEEHWDISVARAFTQTLWPELGKLLWKAQEADTGEEESAEAIAASNAP